LAHFRNTIECLLILWLKKIGLHVASQLLRIVKFVEYKEAVASVYSASSKVTNRSRHCRKTVNHFSASATRWRSNPRRDYHQGIVVKTALMCPPTFFDVREAKNAHMGAAIDRNRAQRQWQSLRQSLEDSGIHVELIDPAEGLDDMVFAANQVFVGVLPSGGKFVVPSRMRYPSRQKEVPFYVQWFRKRGYRIIELELNGEYLEGHGDLSWHPDHSRIWAGYGFRSTRGGVEKFAAEISKMGIPVTPLELVDKYCYHLDTCFCPLNVDAVLLYPEALSKEASEAIRRGFTRVHTISREEALQFVGNGIVANGRFLTPRLTPNLSRILEQEGLTPVVVETSEFEKSGGSVFCMKAFID
jgi:N-dimethylarginine dimethylaminohydrolase